MAHRINPSYAALNGLKSALRTHNAHRQPKTSGAPSAVSAGHRAAGTTPPNFSLFSKRQTASSAPRFGNLTAHALRQWRDNPNLSIQEREQRALLTAHIFSKSNILPRFAGSVLRCINLILHSKTLAAWANRLSELPSIRRLRINKKNYPYLTTLPNGLRIKNLLIGNGNSLNAIPDNISTRTLTLINAQNISSFPRHIKANVLSIINCNEITSLAGTTFHDVSELKINHCAILARLPEDLTAKEIYISNLPKLRTVPKGLRADLFEAHDCEMFSDIGPNARIGHTLTIQGCPMDNIGKGSQVGKTSKCSVEILPPTKNASIRFVKTDVNPCKPTEPAAFLPG